MPGSGGTRDAGTSNAGPPEKAVARRLLLPGHGVPVSAGLSLQRRYEAGHAASMAFATDTCDAPVPNQAVICVHSAPDPTADGIRSDASKRNVAFGLVRNCADNLSMPSVYRLWSTPLFAETQPGATWIRLSAHCGDDRYVCTAWVAGSEENAAVNSPPPSTGVGTLVLRGGR